ncbi:MAG: hypothetical protein P8Z74_19390 [Acidobacteriota bacterium]
MLRNLLVVLGACVLLGGTDLRAQDELIKKYYEDVPVSSANSAAGLETSST